MKQKNALLATQHQLTAPLHTSRYRARLRPGSYSRGRSVCSVWPRRPMSCMTVSIHVRWGRPMGLEWPGMECAESCCLTMTSLGLRTACPSHLTLCRLIRSAMLVWPVRASSSAVEGPSGHRWRGRHPSSASGSLCGRSPVVPPHLCCASEVACGNHCIVLIQYRV